MLAQDAGGCLKSPKLSELYTKLFNCAMEGAHDARHDVLNLCRIVARLHKLRVLLLPRGRLPRKSKV